MDPRHRGLYVRWCQSPRVELLAGEDVGPIERFLIPQEFLQRRSRTLRDQIARLPSHHSQREIALPETAPQTMEEFFVWNFTPNPQIDDRLSFSEVVQLGVFAWKYQVSALSNQVTDMIRHNLANNDWKLEAAVVDAIYQAAPDKSPLREVIKAALGQLPRSSIDGDAWERTWKRNPDLGWDHHKSSDKEWTAKDYLTGSCRFHNHDEIKRRQSLCDGCPYAQEDCYPFWEEDAERAQEPEVKAAAEETPSVEDQFMEEVFPAVTPTEQAVEEVNGLDASAVFEDAPEHAPEETAIFDTTAETNGFADHNLPEEVTEDGDGVQTPQPETNGVKHPFSPEEGPCESVCGDACSDEGIVAANGNGVVTNGLEEKGNEAVHVEAVNGHEVPVVDGKKKKKKKKKRMSFNNGTDNPNEAQVVH
ncbi:uncharacterized protein PV07_01344 [Cladophialophora immunda]|uniref:Uncharacterized protein n=1 Tax=Cladophialophora immunda TaxID=569365 RepID=A0A0D2BAJ1_9EURO|nr:uncharacterized protein PV07_01344 [Cladophialophora immunda]KIW34567.1 hypothetical protein PV07_01344 [Cladophialophora immunda]OQV04503.1 hypothetical protein CLAIMM_09372 [Cladophialophora immunda]